MLKNSFTTALGLDVGEKRVGVARVSAAARLPEPLATLANNDDFSTQLTKYIDEYGVDLIVVGLPRNMSGEETRQSEETKAFVEERLKPATDCMVIYQDETLTSVAAENYPEQWRQKYGLDALAATEILQDFIKSETV